MGGAKNRRAGGRAGRRSARWCAQAAILASAVLLVYPPTRLTAQVGRSPDHSPYQDVKRGRTLILSGGYLTGSRGAVGVGPSNGGMASLRFEVPFGKPLGFFIGAGYGRLSRFIQDPTKDSAAHMSGPITVDAGVVEGGVHLFLTDSRTWHSFAPMIGVSGGAIFARDPSADSSGYRFRAKGMFGPEAALRWYLGRRLALHAQGRLMFWQLNYPLAYKQPSPDGSRVQPLTAPDKEWTRHPWISIGLGWTF